MIFIYSCSENELEDLSLKGESAIKLNRQHDFLIFKNEADLRKTLSNLKELSNEELASWESKYGNFISQKTIYEKAYTEDEKYLERLSKLTENELQWLKEQRGKEFGFSNFTLKNKDLFFFSDEEDVLDYDLKVGDYNPDIVYVINDAGLVQVGDSIYQYLPDNIKIIRDGQTSKLSELKYITESSLEKNVAVINIIKLNSDDIILEQHFIKMKAAQVIRTGEGKE